MNARELKTDVIGGFDWIVLASHRAQIKQDVLPRGRRGPCVASALDQHLLELHEDVGVEMGESQHGDDGGDGGRGRAFLLQTLLRDVERLGDERRELVVDHPAHRRQRLRVDSHHVHRVLRVIFSLLAHREPFQIRRVEHCSLQRLHEEIQRVEVRRHRERAVHADVRVARARHARQIAEALCFVETWKPDDVAGEEDEALARELEELAQHGDGADGEEDGAVLGRKSGAKRTLTDWR